MTTSNDLAREMTLAEYMGQLPAHHRARQEYESALLAERAAARREAIEECASMCETGSQIGVDQGGKVALLAMRACILQLDQRAALPGS